MLVEKTSPKSKRLILHIGHPKTGTTTLQKTLLASRPTLADAGILHPDTGQHHNHKALIPHLTSDTSIMPSGTSLSETVRNSGKKWASVMEEVRTTKQNTIILSSEALFRDLRGNETENLKNHLKPLASEITIAAYLREPASFALSMAQQDIKRQPNFTIPPKDYYRSVLETYKASGLGSMNIQIFDRSNLKGGDIVEDFFTQHLPHFAQERLTRRKDDNTTFSAEAMALIQEVQRKQRSLPKGKARFARIAIENADRELHEFSRPRMHDHIHKAIQSRITDLGWLKDEFDLEFPDIETAVMPQSEANRLCEALDKVEDMCVVDTDRKAELWSMVCKSHSPNHSPLRRLLNRIRNKRQDVS